MTCDRATEVNHNCRSLALVSHLKLLAEFLLMDSVTEIVINQPQQVITETPQGWQYHQHDKLSFEYCQRLAKLIATYSGQKLDNHHPILS